MNDNSNSYNWDQRSLKTVTNIILLYNYFFRKNIFRRWWCNLLWCSSQSWWHSPWWSLSQWWCNNLCSNNNSSPKLLSTTTMMMVTALSAKRELWLLRKLGLAAPALSASLSSLASSAIALGEPEGSASHALTKSSFDSRRVLNSRLISVTKMP